MKDVLRELYAGCMPALDPGRATLAHVRVEDRTLVVDDRRVDLDPAARVLVVAIGKAAVPMARAALDLLPRRVDAVVVAPPGRDLDGPGVRVFHAAHPTPDAVSMAAAHAVLEVLDGCTRQDLVLFLLSGGGSALCEAPLDPGLTLDDMQAFHHGLVTSSLGIVETNTLRKHASAVKGGRLAVRAAPAQQVTLFVSDVPVAHPDAVASGPTMPDPTTRADCAALLANEDLRRRLPEPYVRALTASNLPETPKAKHPAFAAGSWHCLLDSRSVVEAVRARCVPLGWLVEVDTEHDEAPVADAAAAAVRRLRALKAAHPDRTVALVSSGELSCPVTGDGLGGRNQHFALHCALLIEGTSYHVLSAGTDGIDGNSPAAGAIADGTTAARARARGLDPRACLARCDAFTLFAALGDTLMTGPTGTNVRDLRVLVA
ncbi:MAG: DUF4147 domain-containing protein [Planctomycetota bacterium]